MQLSEEIPGDRGPLPSTVYRPLPASALLQSWSYSPSSEKPQTGDTQRSPCCLVTGRVQSSCSSLSCRVPPKSAEFWGVLSGCTMCPDHVMGTLIFLSKVFWGKRYWNDPPQTLSHTLLLLPGAPCPPLPTPLHLFPSQPRTPSLSSLFLAAQGWVGPFFCRSSRPQEHPTVPYTIMYTITLSRKRLLPWITSLYSLSFPSFRTCALRNHFNPPLSQYHLKESD